MHSGLQTGTANSHQSLAFYHNALLNSLALPFTTSTEGCVRIQLLSECHKLRHDSPTKFVLHKANDLLVYSCGKRMILTVATCVKPSLIIAGDVFIEIIHCDVNIHITQPNVITMDASILEEHVVIMKLVHGDLTKI